jgi:lipoate-protein ligase A
MANENRGRPAAAVAARPPAWILAWSEDLAGAGPSPPRPGLALWLPAGGLTAVIGLSQDPDRELELAAMRRDGVGLVRRQSGGGAVLLGPGVLCWEAVAPLAWLEARGEAGIRDAYAALSRPLAESLRRLGAPVFPAGISDLSVGGGSPGKPARKLGGTAQFRKRDRVLVHGSLLLDLDPAGFSRYLKMPSEAPAYRAGRDHAEFCRTLAAELGWSGDGLRERLAEEISAGLAESGWDELLPPGKLSPGAERLRRRKYLSPAWNLHRERPAPLDPIPAAGARSG